MNAYNLLFQTTPDYVLKIDLPEVCSTRSSNPNRYILSILPFILRPLLGRDLCLDDPMSFRQFNGNTLSSAIMIEPVAHCLLRSADATTLALDPAHSGAMLGVSTVLLAQDVHTV